MAKGGRIIDYALGMGQRVEDQAKAAQAVDFIQRNARRLDEETLFDEAAKVAQRALFDYTEKTPFERNLRVFWPFWSWMRNVTPAAARFVARNPSGAARAERAYQQIPGLFGFRPLNPEEQQFAPEYEKMGGALVRPTEDNRLMRIQGAGYTPFQTPQELLLDPGRALLNQFASQWKLPYELAANWDLFRNRAIDPSVGYDLGQRLLGETDVPTRIAEAFTGPPTWKKILQATPLSRYLKDFVSPVMKSVGLGDPSRGESSLLENALAMGTGFKAATVDPLRWKYYYERDKKQRIREIQKAIRYRAAVGDTRMVEELTRKLEEAVAEQAEAP
jgi:hypothetical protein